MTKKKSKLAIIHYHGDEVKKIGKAPTGFPLQVQVRYKKAKTVFASRLGIRYVSSNTFRLEALRESREIADKLINQEINYIEKVRDYFEEKLKLPFKPGFLLDPILEDSFLGSMESFFDKQIVKYDVEKILVSKSVDSLYILDKVRTLRLIRFIKTINPRIFEEIIQKRNNYEVFKAYEEFLLIQGKFPEEEVDKLSFRLMEVDEGSTLHNFKLSFNQMLDDEILAYLEFKHLTSKE
ncbi:hypothetical protein KIH41_17885 [Litoribacter ruber]|uniref:hypothetical protein n=1 Tax=Litoribacter ruber TaxID=702568 RepID=UPI001BDB5023|nr:hypothetical protein [Litoribacter ruber]MBT0813163.1 hypothetical protein [Litoribacter ruber]